MRRCPRCACWATSGAACRLRSRTTSSAHGCSSTSRVVVRRCSRSTWCSGAMRAAPTTRWPPMRQCACRPPCSAFSTSAAIGPAASTAFCRSSRLTAPGLRCRRGADTATHARCIATRAAPRVVRACTLRARNRGGCRCADGKNYPQFVRGLRCARRARRALRARRAGQCGARMRRGIWLAFIAQQPPFPTPRRCPDADQVEAHDQGPARDAGPREHAAGARRHRLPGRRRQLRAGRPPAQARGRPAPRACVGGDTPAARAHARRRRRTRTRPFAGRRPGDPPRQPARAPPRIALNGRRGDVRWSSSKSSTGIASPRSSGCRASGRRGRGSADEAACGGNGSRISRAGGTRRGRGDGLVPRGGCGASPSARLAHPPPVKCWPIRQEKHDDPRQQQQ